MTTGVVYHHRGNACVIRLCVSVDSLRTYYSGPVTVFQEGSFPRWLQSFLESKEVHIEQLPEPSEPVLIRKTQLWRLMRFDRAMYLDADTLVLGPVDNFLDSLSRTDFVATWFAGWLTSGRIMSGRIREWNGAAPDLVDSAIAYGKAVNCGVMGWTKESVLLREWESLTRRGHAFGCNCLTLDEVACQLLLPRHAHEIADVRWNTSGTFGRREQATILHFHGRKHVRGPVSSEWKRAYWRLRDTSSFSEHLSEASGDTDLENYLKRQTRITGTKSFG